ncbi:hypothetical protein V6U90_14000 [Micromonospora sp. CPCC 206060]|uniref:hypothetical protein n=1 Tax=Micromonospora sp. CPCC 206060 TaxID=3122406 RepID=UPI002FEF6240
MAHALFGVTFTSLDGDDDFVLEQLTRDLATDLAELGDVEYVELPPEPDSKGAAEIAVAALSVLTTTEPSYLQAVVETVVAFLNRNAGRRAHLRVADIELTIDRPHDDEVAAMISMVRAAIERNRD